MLPAQSRMRRRGEFSVTVRRGLRAGSSLLSVHLLAGAGEAKEPSRAGFVVSKAVGNAVVRNTVRRRLRSVVGEYLPSLPGGSLLVVRAHPQAATARQADLAAELHTVMGRALRRQVRTVR